jgi:2-dehydro-3-deoxyphosphooctonate aldolase (KDO 8-P synthase)
MDDRTTHLFAKGELFVISGPCVIESASHALQIAHAVSEAGRSAGVAAVFKASFDKANRTSGSSYRGLGMDQGLDVLEKVRRETGLPVLTDIHEPGQAEPVAAVCDILQIPAFLCRQTDLLLAAGRTGRVVNIKKGQFLAPEDMQYAAEKVASSGNRRIILTERGTSFGYRDLVVDFRALAKMGALGHPVVLDVTHSLQQPGAAGGASGGQPQFIELLAKAGTAAGCNGLFFEVHEQPSRALSDGANALRLDLLPELLVRLAEISRLVASFDSPSASTEI